jgi:NAD(P)-dependent dehydrogenase (short-subunit alcohol dehydrogenase family)
MGRVQGKVAFITGAARGQGRSHAVRLAQEGADIIAVDLCRDIESIKYSLAGPDDLKETVRLVEAQDRRILAVQADVRERAQLRDGLDSGLAELGRLDIVVAQAGIAAMQGDPPLQAWADVLDTNLLGTINAIHVALPHLGEGASVIATGSLAAYVNALPMMQVGTDPGGVGYMVAACR